MHNFIVSIIGALIKLLWVFVSVPKEKTSSKKEVIIEPEVVEFVELYEEEELEEEVSKLEEFLEGIQNAKSSSERLELLIEFEEDEKMKELLIKMRRPT